ncbi:Pre-mRNA splicing factor family protein [Theileria parva strain Muguga]|uniref:Pre-mRNA splicing factor n=1 Tax=Theileria parva TaxID=5875 RepID=Q4N6I0_THEPA|nr:Pre-mRNA splicing factor family protein [Theileria parva strain Muguga]EAN34428.1 Pre-mRNA splicing factor family protein [Theileria parva strain Muguga]|eukprot:XP_766711.1 hypothetical protein [Theileria parva strain Muguga]
MDKGKWTGSSKIEAEGLEWLYNDPTQQQNNLESYLLGESIPGARGELRRPESDDKSVGSVLTDSSRVYEQTLNKFREDPLFIIKKLETQQQQIIHKYSNLKAKQRKFGDSQRDTHRDKGRERDTHRGREREGEGATNRYRDRERELHKHRDSERELHKHSERELHKDRGRGRERERYRRSRSNSPHRKSHKSHNKPDSKSRRSDISHDKLDSKSDKSPVRRVKGPERPRRYDPMKYAFGVNEDICPPDEILETANRKMQIELLNKLTEPTEHVVSVDEQLDSMIQEGKLHIKDKLNKISQLQNTDEKELTAVDSVKREEYLMSIKKKAFEEANLSNILKHKHNKLL